MQGTLHVVLNTMSIPAARVARCVAGGVDCVHVMRPAFDRLPELAGHPEIARRLVVHAPSEQPKLGAVSPMDTLSQFVLPNTLPLHLPPERVQEGNKFLNTAATTVSAGTPHHRVIGATCHSLDEVSAAVRVLPSLEYLFIGTMYPTPSHPEKPTVEGPALLKDVRGFAATMPIPPLIAIGGIELRHIKELVEAGADGIAVIRSILHADDPQDAALSMKKEIMRRLEAVAA
ncbi:Thiamine-phosphate synthase [Diplonema papillatum]|nr:Thiamine-phosphate synthase [Diplonema papillatum]